jgi:hypothetical protein
MEVPSPAEQYDTVSAAEADVADRLELVPGADEWLDSPLRDVVISHWTAALTGFQANVTVSPREAACFNQIGALFDRVKQLFVDRADLLGVGTMATLTPGHVLFMITVRRLQSAAGESTNFNPHKFRVLLDDRYTVSETQATE